MAGDTSVNVAHMVVWGGGGGVGVGNKFDQSRSLLWP